MSFLKNTVSLLAIFSVMPVAYAVTARPSVMSSAMVNSAVRRMPTMTAYINGSSGNAVTQPSSGASLLKDMECVDAYSECIKGADACGSNFEECTTGVLFHAQMPDCISTLAQCSAGGITSLFGAGSTANNLSTPADGGENEFGEITEYKYPTTDSVLGQMIAAAHISNRYDTSDCVRRYTSCLRKDSVCGIDFELCTTNTEFKKQSVFCDSTLARCASDGKQELFGNGGATSSTAPTKDSRIGEMITEGAALAAVNAVSTCYKVVDQCILNACSKNPYKCYEDSSVAVQELADKITGATDATVIKDELQSFADNAGYGRRDVRSHIERACASTIGANKYCYATFLGDGVMPTSSQLRDENNQADIFDQAYSERMNSGIKAKIADLMDKFDAAARTKCLDTITACAMRTCGGGSGAACYSMASTAKASEGAGTTLSGVHINGYGPYEEIKSGCESIVNTDANCLYAATNLNGVGTYNYMFSNAGAFDELFPVYNETGNDPIGAVATLNAKLSTSYNDAAIAAMKKQCQAIATGCVKSACGTDYVDCYRPRTDAMTTLTNTGNTSFDESMNKAGGVLDYGIVLGLCVDTIKNSDVCAEHLAIEQKKVELSQYKNVPAWGGASSVRNGWLDAGTQPKDVQKTNTAGQPICKNSAGEEGVCYTEDYTTQVMVDVDTATANTAAATLFRELISDLEIEAQARYKAKLTREMNGCLATNNGGILAAGDTGSTFMWSKLKKAVPQNYTTMGLKPGDFVASNDLYGSFCRIRVTLKSGDKYIQQAINDNADWSTAYFAAGDAFTCGSWIPNSAIQEMANAAGSDARSQTKASQPKIEGWMAALGALGGGAGGAFLASSIQDGSILGGLTGRTKGNKNGLSAETCGKYYNSYLAAVSSNESRAYVSGHVKNLTNLVSENDTNSTSMGKVTKVNSALSEFNGKLEAFNEAQEAYEANKNDYNKKTAAETAQKDLNKAQTDLTTAMDSLRADCVAMANNNTGEKKGLSRGAASGIGAGAGALAGGLLTWGVTRSIQNSKLDTAEQRAIQEFMDNVGSKIQCYIGADQVGVYGDTIPTSID